ncbi:MAG TPA: ATP-binding cassette domain-containing protein [Victivallales bacterium]|nr:ATP-binding cassette domain-containing protein [Victivallales bacterium]
MLTLNNISKKIGNFQISDINLKVSDGEYFVILGKSGAGKSVILELISGLKLAELGNIALNGVDITKKPIQKRDVGMVFQNHALFPHMTVKKNIDYAVKYGRGDFGNDKFGQLCTILGINSLLDRFPETLSPGEAQRVAMARTLVTNPSVLLLDEPLSALDTQIRGEIRCLLRKINRGEFNGIRPLTIIHVTHDYEEALALATRIAVIERGNITQVGTPDEIFRHPKTEFIANFVGVKNFYRGRMDQRTATFITHDIKKNKILFYTAKTGADGEGCIILRSEDITISNNYFESSARNVFRGRIIDIENVRSGLEVVVDIGNLFICSLITKISAENLNLYCGKQTYISFKATACKFIKN